MSMTMKKRIFVTVGTTEFDPLIEKLTSDDALDVLSALGYTDITLQIGGKAKFEPSKRSMTRTKPSITYYRFKDTISKDVAEADLIISHAGAGSVADSLYAGKHVLVVINEELMGNHQIELAYKLASEGHLHYCSVTSLIESLQSLDFDTLTSFPPGEPHKFAHFLDELLGFQ